MVALGLLLWIPTVLALAPLKPKQPARAQLAGLQQPGIEMAKDKAAQSKSDPAPTVVGPEHGHAAAEAAESAGAAASDAASESMDAAGESLESMGSDVTLPPTNMPEAPDRKAIGDKMDKVGDTAKATTDYAGYTPLAAILFLNNLFSPHGPAGKYVAKALLIGGLSQLVTLAIQFGLWWYFCLGKKRSNSEPRRMDFQGALAPVGLFSCFSTSRSVKYIIEAICCPLCLFAETVEKATEKDRPFPAQDFGVLGRTFVTGCLTLVTGNIYAVYSALSFRFSLMAKPPPRQRTALMSAACCMECLKVIFCTPCALRQQADYVELYKAHYNAAEFLP
jgi:Cys-rich protein (TIGR01571 family)